MLLLQIFFEQKPVCKINEQNEGMRWDGRGGIEWNKIQMPLVLPGRRIEFLLFETSLIFL